jgi:hypothetical protein
MMTVAFVSYELFVCLFSPRMRATALVNSVTALFNFRFFRKFSVTLKSDEIFTVRNRLDCKVHFYIFFT